MINAYSCTYVNVSDEDRMNVECARDVILEIHEAVEKVGGNCETEMEWLYGTIDILTNILKGKPIDC